MKHAMLLPVLFLAACGDKVGTVRFELITSGDNDRAISVDINGQQRAMTAEDLIVVFDKVSLEGAANVDLIAAKDFARLESADVAASFEATVAEGTFDSLAVTLGVADAATAAASGQQNIINRTFHAEGTIDFDGDPANGEEAVLIFYAPSPTTLNFAQPITVTDNQTTVVQLALDVEALLAGVNMGVAIDNGKGDLLLTEIVNQTETDKVPGNLAALTLVVQ